jgi:large subunit ribosomal protein L29
MSKRSESIKALRQMNDEELVVHLRQQRRKLFEVRFQQATGQVENHRLIRDLRHEIGRTMTVQIESQRELAPVVQTTGPAALGHPPGRAKRGPVPSLRRHPSSAPDASDAADAKPPRRVRRARAKAVEEPEAAETALADEKEGKTDA